MNTLHLLRHAKSAWDQPQLADRERPLNRRGRRDAPRMGAALSQSIRPMDIAVSPARRAQLTLEGLCKGWPELARCHHRTVAELYTFDADDLLDWLARQDALCEELFLIGHNPALTDLVNILTGADTLANLPTCGYVCLRVGAWPEVSRSPAHLVRCLFPKMLPPAGSG